MKNNTMQYINPREREVIARLAYEKVSIITKEQFDKYFNFPKRAKEKCQKNQRLSMKIRRKKSTSIPTDVR